MGTVNFDLNNYFIDNYNFIFTNITSANFKCSILSNGITAK